MGLTLQSCTRQSTTRLSETSSLEVWLLASPVGWVWAWVELLPWRRCLGVLGSSGHLACFPLS